MPSNADIELSPSQRAWVAAYAREEAALDGVLRRTNITPVRSAGRVARGAKAVLLYAVNRCLLPWSVVDAVFARWPALRSA